MTPDQLRKNLADRVFWAFVAEREFAEQIADDVVEFVWPVIRAEKDAAWNEGRAAEREAIENSKQGATVRVTSPYCACPPHPFGIETDTTPDDRE